MRRTERLFQIIQILRSTRSPITGRELAGELEISLSTLYRDMAELHAQRIPITGEAGIGYIPDDGYEMPPLMLRPLVRLGWHPRRDPHSPAPLVTLSLNSPPPSQRSSAPLFWTEVRSLFKRVHRCLSGLMVPCCATPSESGIACN